jgi:hypothetical protein
MYIPGPIRYIYIYIHIYILIYIYNTCIYLGQFAQKFGGVRVPVGLAVKLDRLKRIRKGHCPRTFTRYNSVRTLYIYYVKLTIYRTFENTLGTH